MCSTNYSQTMERKSLMTRLHGINIKYELMREEAVAPYKKTALSDAGFDLVSTEDLIIRPGDRVTVPTGLKFEIPKNICGLICPRSGLAFNYGVTVLNSPGVIDPSYRGEIKVILINLGKQCFTINKGDRIAQIVFSYFPSVFLKEAIYISEDTERGISGFGSSGV